MLAGAATAASLLGLIAWAMLRYSARLPITQFFAWSAALIAVLAVVLAGKGIGGLQEAGLLGVTPLAEFPRIPMLGVYPTRSEEHTSELQSLMRISYAVFCLKKKKE